MVYLEVGFIGCELFFNGVVGVFGYICDGGLINVWLFMGDVLEVIEWLFDVSFDWLYLLYFDLWCKVCYVKWCMVNYGLFDIIVVKLKLGVEFWLGIDDLIYCCWLMMIMN